MMRRIVVLPDPFGPTSPTRDRGGITQSTPFRTSCTPNERLTPLRRSITRVYTAGAAGFNGGAAIRGRITAPCAAPIVPPHGRSISPPPRSPGWSAWSPVSWRAGTRPGRRRASCRRRAACRLSHRSSARRCHGIRSRMRGDLQVLLERARRNDSPRFWGYVAPPALASGAVADWLASGINQNLTAFRSSPGAALLELQVTGWIREMIGLPRGASGLLVSGGSIANLAGLAAAREAAVPYDLARRGLRGGPGRPLTLYASEEAHHAIQKAAAVLGIGRDFVRLVPTDRRLRLDVAALGDAIRRDRRARLRPFAVVASAGTVTTGAVDPLRAIWRLCRREKLWLHVDACYGGFAVLAPSARPLLRGLSLADSIALDPHKWLYAPVDAGCVLYRDPRPA